MKAFAGADVAQYYPEDDDYLLERDETVVHFEVASATGDAGQLLP